MNHPNGWMPGWMDGGMWMWSGICIVVLALVAIGINVMSKK